ncbi:unnamed protein product [Rotaria sp. Silwood2]|nr:unnamed protein product [Rotaria sp. Silwood2]
MLQSIFRKIEELKNELINQELLNSDTQEFSKNRDEFYRKLNEKFFIINQAKIIIHFNMQNDIHKIEQECLESLETKIKTICSSVDKLLTKFSQENILTRVEYDHFNLYYCNLISIRQEIKVHIEKIEEVIFDKIQMWECSIKKESTVQDVTMNLKNMKRVSNNIPSFKIKINEPIDEMLKCYKTTHGAMAFARLGTIFNQDRDGIGQNQLKGNLVDKKQLLKRYDEFHDIYKKTVKENLSTNMKLDKLISDIKLIAGNTRQNANRITLQKADHYFEAEGLEDQNNYLFQPHAAQVISIFRMLGIGDIEERLINNLVQIGTGEGKSVTLGVTASILALLSFDVHCACYSEYLSQRDYSIYLPLFDSLGIMNSIHYGTFNKLCEDIINENGDIRQVVEQLISTNTNHAMKHSREIERAKILLIDEVDVFFSREFYGNVYTPSASLQDSTITSLINLIWTKRKSKLKLNRVISTDEYKACCDRFPNWEPLIREAVQDMLSDVNNFESHDYVVSQDKIGYIEQDNIVYNVVYGYKTLFAYHCEREKGKRSKESLHENISIRINCGSFSYAEIPLQFAYIMGVTSTLETLSEPEKKVIENNYRIMKNTYVPSVFRENNLRFIEKDDIMIENSFCFESKQKLMEFYNSDALTSIKESVVYLTEDASLEEKEKLIKRATLSGQITLFTRTYGRGTDFVCHDQTVAANGGTHVIQTFLSEEFSEEKQIKGRTARQSDQGSYSMILLDRDLEKFHKEKVHIEDIKKGKGFLTRITNTVTDALRFTETYETIYDLLHVKRTDLF